MKTLLVIFCCSMLLASSMQAQDIEPLRAAFPSYELNQEIENAQLLQQLEKPLSKTLVKAFLLDENGAYYEKELHDKNYDWYPLAHVPLSDKLDVFVVASGEKGTLTSGTLLEFITVYKGAYQDDVLVDAVIGGYLENGIALIYSSSVLVAEDYFQVNEYSYQDAGLDESYEVLQAQVEEKGDYKEVVYQINRKGKISE